MFELIYFNKFLLFLYTYLSILYLQIINFHHLQTVSQNITSENNYIYMKTKIFSCWNDDPQTLFHSRWFAFGVMKPLLSLSCCVDQSAMNCPTVFRNCKNCRSDTPGCWQAQKLALFRWMGDRMMGGWMDGWMYLMYEWVDGWERFVCYCFFFYFCCWFLFVCGFCLLILFVVCLSFVCCFCFVFLFVFFVVVCFLVVCFLVAPFAFVI